jgi:transcription-repair coupling factor (superfamily II helicase)
LRDVSIASNQARLAPLALKTSAEMRLHRLSRGAIFKPDSQQLVVPIKAGAEPANFLVEFLRELVPQQ